MKKKYSQAGLTLIELMATLTIAALLLLVALPSMAVYRQNAELTSATNTLLAAINTARGEAMKRGRSAMVVPAASGAGWKAGWVVFVDSDKSLSYNAEADLTVYLQSTLPAYINVTGNGTAATGSPYMMFDASGYSRTKSGGFGALTLTLTRNDLSGRDLFEQTRRIVIASTGRTRACKPASATDVTCAANMTE